MHLAGGGAVTTLICSSSIDAIMSDGEEDVELLAITTWMRTKLSRGCELGEGERRPMLVY